MRIRIDNSISNNLVIVTVICSNLEELELRKNFYKTILLQFLNDSSINSITIEPQDYSLAYDIDNYQQRNVKGHHFGINNITHCNLELIEAIVSSEEFRRTLLLIVKTQSHLSDANLMSILDLIKGKDISDLKGVVYCEDDGDSLYLYNTTVDFEKILSISKTITGDVTVQTL